MKLRYILFLIAFAAVSNNTFAQYSRDAVRFSTFQNGSTSRIKGIGNAATAIGGDLSAISANPAGLGYFTQSEASITPEFDGHTSNSAYIDRLTTATKSTPNFSQIGVVIYSRLNTPPRQDKTKGWLSMNFGASYNRTNNFDERVNYGGFNNKNSINDYYANLAKSEGINNGSLQDWAYQQKLISAFGTTTNFAPNSYPGVNQTGVIDRTGGQNALDLSVGTNYSNRVYFGLNIGIVNLRYKSTKTFNETGTATIPEANGPADRGFNATYTQNQTTKGEGFNAKLGVLFKVIEAVRLGATISTPTYLTVDDTFSEELNNSLSSGSKYSNGPIEYPLTYTMRTPFKASGGMSVFVGQYGFITGDIEYIDYSSTRLSSNEYYDNTFDNNIIKNTYRSVVNLRAGAEVKVAKAFALRGGYGLQPSPLKSGGFDTKILTGGLGYRLGNYYVDAAYMHVKGSRSELPYDIGPTTPSTMINQTNNNFYLTAGFRF